MDGTEWKPKFRDISAGNKVFRYNYYYDNKARKIIYPNTNNTNIDKKTKVIQGYQLSLTA